MTYRQIETSREIRLWVTGIIGPLIMGAATVVASDPELVRAAKVKTKEQFSKLKQRIKRGEGA